MTQFTVATRTDTSHDGGFAISDDRLSQESKSGSHFSDPTSSENESVEVPWESSLLEFRQGRLTESLDKVCEKVRQELERATRSLKGKQNTQRLHRVANYIRIILPDVAASKKRTPAMSTPPKKIFKLY